MALTWITGNYYLNVSQMTNNATIIWGYFNKLKWTLNAVAGMLGNMQTESTINPGIWENLDSGNVNKGFGLVQWTPATKLIEWAGTQFRNGYKQCDRIQWEMENGQQWIAQPGYDMTFREFSTSTLTPYELAMYFIHNYERPENPNQPERGSQANYWYEILSGVVPPDPPYLKKNKTPIWMYKYII